MRLNRWKVRELADQKGLMTQEQIAERIGVSRQALSNWMRGASLSTDTLAALCKLLDCTPNDILILEDDPKEEALTPQLA